MRILKPIIIGVIVFIVVLGAILLIHMSKLEKQYQSAIQSMEQGQYADAIVKFTYVHNYKDSQTKMYECHQIIQYSIAISYMESNNFKAAIKMFEFLDGYKDSEAKIDECKAAIGTKD